jgi:hypothetical protein
VKFVHDHWLAIVAALKGKLTFSRAVTINYRIHSSQQLGAPLSKTFFQKANNIADFDKDINSMQIMLEELNVRFHLTKQQNNVFANKIKFYLFRKNLPCNRLARMPRIIENLFSGNYHKFASGFLSVAKDLFLAKNCLKVVE